MGLRKIDRATVLGLLYDSHPDGRPRFSHSEIGRITGMSRERIRQLARQMLGETGRERQLKMVLVPIKPIRCFRGLIRKWLAEIDCWWCGTCFMVIPLKDKIRTRCRECNRANVHWHYHHGKFGQYMKEYRKAHPEVGKRASKRYIEKNREKVKERQRKWREANMETVREYWRRAQEKRRAKLGKEGLRKLNRAKYARRKARQEQAKAA